MMRWMTGVHGKTTVLTKSLETLFSKKKVTGNLLRIPVGGERQQAVSNNAFKGNLEKNKS